MKTFKGWQKSGTDLAEYLGKEPVRIDEEIYNDFVNEATNHFDGPVQIPRAEYYKGYTSCHMTATAIDDKYFYLGILPSFV